MRVAGLVFQVVLVATTAEVSRVPVRRRTHRHAAKRARRRVEARLSKEARLRRRLLEDAREDETGVGRRRSTDGRVGDKERAGPAFVSLSSREQAEQHSEEVSSCFDVVYYGDVGLGTPSQTLQVIFDTGSSDFWVASTDCTDCEGLTLYDRSQSSSYKHDGQAFSIQYADDDRVSGTRAFDALHWAGLSVGSQGFAEIDSVGKFFICGAEDGLLGMGFESISRLRTKPPFETLRQAGVVDRGVFAFDLPSEDDDAPGELTLGGLDPAHYVGELAYVDLVSPRTGFWEVPVQTVTMGGASIPTNGARTAIIDTGTSLIVARPAAVHAVATALNAVCYQANGNTYTIKQCSAFAQTNAVFDLIVAPCEPGDEFTLDFRFGASGSTADVSIPSKYLLTGAECREDEFRDCAGLCWPDTYLAWTADDDDACDDGAYGIDFNCPRFDCDNGLCDRCGVDAQVPHCFLGMDADTYADYWLLGDTFLTSTYTAFDADRMKLGFAPSNKALTPAPSLTPFPTPTLAPADEHAGDDNDDNLYDDDYYDDDFWNSLFDDDDDDDDDKTTGVPTALPHPPPTALPVSEPTLGDVSCQDGDDPNWHTRKSDDHDCDWVALSPDRRCAEASPDGRVAIRACPVACGLCEPTTEPTASPGPTYVPTRLPPAPTLEPFATTPSLGVQTYAPTVTSTFSPTSRPSPKNTQSTLAPTVDVVLLVGGFVLDATPTQAAEPSLVDAVANAAGVAQTAVAVDRGSDGRITYVIHGAMPALVQALTALSALTPAEMDTYLNSAGLPGVATVSLEAPRIVSEINPTPSPVVSFPTGSDSAKRRREQQNTKKDKATTLWLIVAICVAVGILLVSLAVKVALVRRSARQRGASFRRLDPDNTVLEIQLDPMGPTGGAPTSQEVTRIPGQDPASDDTAQENTAQGLSNGTSKQTPARKLGRLPYQSVHAADAVEDGMVVINTLHASAADDENESQE